MFLKTKAPQSFIDFCVKMAVEEVSDVALLAPRDADVQSLIIEPAGIAVGPDVTRAKRAWFQARLVYDEMRCLGQTPVGQSAVAAVVQRLYRSAWPRRCALLGILSTHST